jgi:Lon protease-like protein
MFEPHVGEEGLLPDLQTLFELIPENVESTKLYISAEVEFHAQEEETTEDQQEVLKEILDHVLHRIGKVLRIEEDILKQWVKERVDHSISEDPNSVYTVSALVVNELESKQQILACNTLEEALEELLHHVEMVQEEE